jgi:putative hydrolase of the HAD superfamily
MGRSTILIVSRSKIHQPISKLVNKTNQDDKPMPENPVRYPTILFDWGDTVMRDHPEITIPMVEWETVEVIEGIADVLAYLHSSGRQILLATSAEISDEGQIRGALARGGLDIYFSRIYCFKNTRLPKGEAFYRYLLNDLQVSPSDVLMVGDSFEKDVQIPNTLGMFAVWFNPRSDETRKGELHVTVHSMPQLRAFFKALDQKK